MTFVVMLLCLAVAIPTNQHSKVAWRLDWGKHSHGHVSFNLGNYMSGKITGYPSSLCEPGDKYKALYRNLTNHF